MFTLKYDTTKALKNDKKKLLNNRKTSNIIRKKLEEFRINPESSQFNIKQMQPKSADRFRLRFWDYRVIYSIDFGNDIIIIHRIWSRKDIYK